MGSAAYVFAPTSSVNVRHGLGGGREVQARGELFWVVGSEPGVTVGAGLSQQLAVNEAKGTALSVNASASGSLFPSDTWSDDGGRVTAGYGYLTGLYGTDRAYGGLRITAGSVSDDDGTEVFAGPVVGFRVGREEYVGLEVGLYTMLSGGFETGGTWVAPSITFGLQPDRETAGTIPALAEPLGATEE